MHASISRPKSDPVLPPSTTGPKSRLVAGQKTSSLAQCSPAAPIKSKILRLLPICNTRHLLECRVRRIQETIRRFFHLHNLLRTSNCSKIWGQFELTCHPVLTPTQEMPHTLSSSAHAGYLRESDVIVTLSDCVTVCSY